MTFASECLKLDIDFGPQKNFLLSNKILDSTKLKVFADDKWNVVKPLPDDKF